MDDAADLTGAQWAQAAKHISNQERKCQMRRIESHSRMLARLAFLLSVVSALIAPAANGQSFDAASVKPTAGPPSGISCSGGPGTSSPGSWRCSGMPLALVISKAFGFQGFQFSTHDPCCLARFDFVAKVPEGTTRDQFSRMLQNLLRERFKLSFHYQQKQIAIYELTLVLNGLKLKQSPPDAPRESDEPWWAFPGGSHSLGNDGYPVFPAGHGGLASSAGRHRWTGFHVTTAEIAKTLSEELVRPVVDSTGLEGDYDVDLKWAVDLDFLLSERARAEFAAQVGESPDTKSGPPLLSAVQGQLGLRLNSKKGPGEIVVVDHVEKVPAEN